MKKSLLVFDFDGTIADTLAVAVDIVNELGEEFGYPYVNAEEFVALKHKRISELLRLSGLSWYQLPLFVKRARESFRAHVERVTPIVQMPEILQTLHRRGYRMGILTSNTQDVVQSFLSKNGIHLFEFIHAPNSIFGKGKVLKSLQKTYGLAPNEMVMIGDEARDVEAARKARVDAVAVTWGFHSENTLRSVDPQFVVEAPRQLLHLFPPRQIVRNPVGKQQTH